MAVSRKRKERVDEKVVCIKTHRKGHQGRELFNQGGGTDVRRRRFRQWRDSELGGGSLLTPQMPFDPAQPKPGGTWLGKPKKRNRTRRRFLTY